MAPCDPVTDCPATGSECISAICKADKTCGTENVAKDTAIGAQTPNDCKMAVCDGNGGIGSKDDNADIKDDGNPCTTDSCAAGAEVHAPEVAGHACSDPANAKAKICDGASKCVECNTATQDTDCASHVCQANACVIATCNDGVKNGNETDLNCGGADCGPCANGKACLVAGDCTSSVCTGLVCQVPVCSDTVKNGAETDVDCGGGACVKCGPLKGCKVDGDCVGGSCNGTTCNVTCTDLVKNNGESDIDCGGANCGKCTNGKACVGNNDCTSIHCVGLLCVAPTCADGIKNQNETDVDCAGPCPTKCGPNKTCFMGSNCIGGVCSGGGTCTPNCSDTVKNNLETDIDCGGGACVKCALGKACLAGSDCTSTTCTANVCALPLINGCNIATATDMTGMANVAVTFPNAGFTYSPPCLKVSVGTVVTFNGSFVGHPLQGGTVVGGVATPSAVGPFAVETNMGVSTPFTMTSAGTFPYYCTFHYPAGMFGTVFVQ